MFPDSRRSRDQRELCFHARSFDASQLDASQQIVSPEFVGGKAATVRGPTQQAIGRHPDCLVKTCPTVHLAREGLFNWSGDAYYAATDIWLGAACSRARMPEGGVTCGDAKCCR